MQKFNHKTARFPQAGLLQLMLPWHSVNYMVHLFLEKKNFLVSLALTRSFSLLSIYRASSAHSFWQKGSSAAYTLHNKYCKEDKWRVCLHICVAEKPFMKLFMHMLCFLSVCLLLSPTHRKRKQPLKPSCALIEPEKNIKKEGGWKTFRYCEDIRGTRKLVVKQAAFICWGSAVFACAAFRSGINPLH